MISRKYIYIIITALLIVSCGKRKPDFSGNKAVSYNIFKGAFPIVALPYSITDTTFQSINDSISISINALANTVLPDSVVHKYTYTYGYSILHPIATFKIKDVSYYLVNFFHQADNANNLWLWALSNNGKWIADKEWLVHQPHSTNEIPFHYSLTVTTEPTFIESQERVLSDLSTLYSKTGWTLNDSNAFVVVMTDSNIPSNNAEVEEPMSIPMDTTATATNKGKWDGTYYKDKRSYMIVKNAPNHQYSFYLSMQGIKGGRGSLKGLVDMRESNEGDYKEQGGICEIHFVFEKNKVIIKENGKCAGHRSRTILFDGSFIKRQVKKVNIDHNKKKVAITKSKAKHQSKSKKKVTKAVSKKKIVKKKTTTMAK